MTSKPTSRLWVEDKYADIKPLPDPPKDLDAMQQMRHIVRTHMILDDYFSSRTDVLVNGDGYLCYDTRNRANWTRPDCVVAFGVDPEAIEARNGYVISEVGKPPEFVLEVASESTGWRDVTVKKDIYTGYGIAEYWRFDRSGGKFHGVALAGDLLVDGVYQPVETSTNTDGVTWGRSPVLGLDLCWHEGRLRFYDPVAGEYLPDLREMRAYAAIQAEARASAEAKANAAAAEVRRLREELRRQTPE